MAGGLLDFLQSASNAAASNVTGPVDGIAWLLRKAGIPVPDAPVGSSDWAKRHGLMRDVPQSAASVAGETVGLLSPMIAAAKAPQIAKGLLTMGENAAAPTMLNRQRGVLGMADDYKGKLEGLAYQIEHKPMTEAGGASRLHALETSFGPDVYGPNALHFFGSGRPEERAALRLMKQVKGNPNAMVTIYRGVPEGASSINPGDWVTVLPDVAAQYGNVVKMKVPASHITSWPDSLLEFGYFPPAAK